MKLAYTNTAFAQHGVPMAGVPVILTDEMVIPGGPQAWLFYIALDRGRTRSPATWRSYAEALFDWLQTCQTNGWKWNGVEEGHLRAYRNQMLYHPSSVTGRAYSTRTVNGRLRRLAMFYNWAFRRGLVGRVPFEYDTVRAPISADAQMLAHLRAGDTLPALDLTVREYFDMATVTTPEPQARSSPLASTEHGDAHQPDLDRIATTVGHGRGHHSVIAWDVVPDER
jgi:hypothetical protein